MRRPDRQQCFRGRHPIRDPFRHRHHRCDGHGRLSGRTIDAAIARECNSLLHLSTPYRLVHAGDGAAAYLLGPDIVLKTSHTMRTRVRDYPLMTSESGCCLQPCERRNSEAGQASILMVVMLALILLTGVAFAVDLSDLWFHRQSAQSAADAACLAGATDLYAITAGVTPPSAGFTAGTASDCVSSPGASMCSY